MRKLRHDELLDIRHTPASVASIPRHPVRVLVNNIRSLYNVGSLFRTCDAACVEQIILTGFTPFPPRKEISKTALGAEETVPWVYHEDPVIALSTLKQEGCRIFAVELTDTARIHTSLTIDDFPCVLVLGNEIRGVDEHILEQCDDALMIPMYGVKHSLNVAVAAGIVIYEAIQQYRTLSAQ